MKNIHTHLKSISAICSLGLSIPYACSLLLLLPTASSYAGTLSANTQATASVAATCTIAAQNLNFGALTLPLSSQSASTSMTVLCSKSHAYTVGLAYGGIYGSGGGSGTAYGTVVNTGSQYNCVYTYTVGGQSYQASVGNGQSQNCPGYNYSVPAYTYGEMIGSAKGDKIGYSIQVPGNAGEVWNNGQNNYSSTGTGVSQTIPVVGTIMPSQSGSAYPTPDSYADTVVATVSF
jgi:spore coat protein U-like protein